MKIDAELSMTKNIRETESNTREVVIRRIKKYVDGC